MFWLGIKEYAVNDALQQCVIYPDFVTAFAPLLRLSPPPSDRDYYFNLDDTEGACDLFDVPLLTNYWNNYSRCLTTSVCLNRTNKLRLDCLRGTDSTRFVVTDFHIEKIGSAFNENRCKLVKLSTTLVLFYYIRSVWCEISLKCKDLSWIMPIVCWKLELVYIYIQI